MPRANEGQIEIRGLNFPNQVWAVNPFQGNLVGNPFDAAIADGNFEEIPQPILPIPIQPDFVYHFQGMDLVVPGWARYLTQEIDGRIIAHECKPADLMDRFIAQIGRWKIIVKPESYELILHDIENF